MQVSTSVHSSAHQRASALHAASTNQIRTVGTMTSEYQSDVYRAGLRKHAEPQTDQNQPTPFFVNEVEPLREVHTNAVRSCAM
jgi:hypothetical protein